MDWKERTILLAPRSPDLTTLDFFLWAHMKTIVYATNLYP